MKLEDAERHIMKNELNFTLLVIQLTNQPTKQLHSLFWEVDIRSATQEIPRLLGGSLPY
jgi:hypothetical protein